MRARTTTLEMPPLAPPPIVLKRRLRPTTVATWIVRWVFFAALCFASFAIAHRRRAHQAGDTECCASASAQKGR